MGKDLSQHDFVNCEIDVGDDGVGTGKVKFGGKEEFECALQVSDLDKDLPHIKFTSLKAIFWFDDTVEALKWLQKFERRGEKLKIMSICEKDSLAQLNFELSDAMLKVLNHED